MTEFNHVKGRSRRKRSKPRDQQPMSLGRDLDALIAHRELAYIRNPSAERLRKLEQARRWKAQEDSASARSERPER